MPARIVGATSHTLWREPSVAISIRDPIHGAIRLSHQELAIVDHPIFQRLRGIKQLGFTDQAFPGATHTRYAHGLGAMEVATRMFDSVFALRRGVLPKKDWERLRQLLRGCLYYYMISGILLGPMPAKRRCHLGESLV